MARELRIPAYAPPPSAGEMLKEEFLDPLGLTVTEFAKHIGVQRGRISEIINGRRGVTPDTAMRFGRALGTSAQFWLNLQQMVDLYEAQHSAQAAKIRKIRLVNMTDAA